jgi:hypothetical protein
VYRTTVLSKVSVKQRGCSSRAQYQHTIIETVKKDDEGNDVKDYKGVKYYYGLKEDALIEKVFTEEYRGRKIRLETFKRKLLDGKLEGFFVGREVVHGQDIVIAYCTKESDPEAEIEEE